MTKRVAIITHEADLAVVQRFLPWNYTAEKTMLDSIIIEGEDNAGWTLDGYVIPRLASGGYYAREIAGDDAFNKEALT